MAQGVVSAIPDAIPTLAQPKGRGSSRATGAALTAAVQSPGITWESGWARTPCRARRPALSSAVNKVFALRWEIEHLPAREVPRSFILLPPKLLLSGVRLRELRSGLRLALTCFSSLIWAKCVLQRSLRCMIRNSGLSKISDFNCRLNNRGSLVLY